MAWCWPRAAAPTTLTFASVVGRGGLAPPSSPQRSSVLVGAPALPGGGGGTVPGKRERGELLFASQCVRVTMEETEDDALVIRIVAHGGPRTDAQCAIDGIIEVMDQVLARGEPYSVLWDLREAPELGMRDLARLIQWAISRRPQLAALTQGMAVIVDLGTPVAQAAQASMDAFGANVPFKMGKNPRKMRAFVGAA